MGYREKYYKEHPVEKVIDSVLPIKTEIHHIIPRSEGGGDRESNLIPVGSWKHDRIHREESNSTREEKKDNRDYLRKLKG